MELYVQESGTKGAPTIVFLHGVGTSSWMWWRQTAYYPDFHCINLDLPGHGKSLHVQWISLEDTAKQIAEVIQNRATNGRAHIVGLSLGAYIGLILIEHHTSFVDFAVLSGLTCSPMPNRILLGPQLWLLSMNKKSGRLLERHAKSLPLTAAEQSAFVENFMKMSMETYRTIYKEVAVFRVSAALSQVHVPTLISAGGNESKIILQAVEILSGIMPEAKGCIAPGLGHGWNLEAPDLFNAMVRAWIQTESLPKGLMSMEIKDN